MAAGRTRSLQLNSGLSAPPAPAAMIARMSSSFRERMRDERGLISAGGLVLIGILILGAYLLLAATEGDSDQFGSVPIPGKEQVELPKGDVDIYYFEKANPDAGVTLIVPSDLIVSVVGSDGESVQVDSRGDKAESTGEGMAELIGAIDVPAEGAYTVTTQSSQTGQRIEPAVTFGQGPFAAIKHRLDDVLDALKGPIGIVVIVLLLGLFLWPRYKLARRRARYKDQV
jgi:hypothetical protein